MKENLYDISKKYIEVIDKIEKTVDPRQLQTLEEKRVDLHGRLLDLLKSQGIKFKDRDHATRIAMRIAKGEL